MRNVVGHVNTGVRTIITAVRAFFTGMLLQHVAFKRMTLYRRIRTVWAFVFS